MRVISMNRKVSVNFNNGDVAVEPNNKVYFIWFYPTGCGSPFPLGTYQSEEFCKEVVERLTRLSGFSDIVYVEMPEGESEQIIVNTVNAQMPYDVFLKYAVKKEDFQKDWVEAE